MSEPIAVERCLPWVIHVISAIPACPVRPKFWHRGAKRTSASDCRRIAICEWTHQRRAASPTLTGMLASLACAPRRLACRYWAGRVALRENRAPTHRLKLPGRSEAARPKTNQAGVFWPSGAPLRPVPDVRPALGGCRAVRDSTLVAWYRAFTHLARDGAYDSHPSGALVRVQSATGRHDFLESGGYLSNDGTAA